MKAGFVGAGKMAEAIMASLLKNKRFEAHEIFACDIDAQRRKIVKQRLGVNVFSATASFVETVDVVFLAVKPQDLGAAMEPLATQLNANHLVVSIAAGRRLEGLEASLPSARVARVMPNLPCQVSEGMSVYCLGTRTAPSDAQTVERLLSSFGKVLALPEERFDAVTALSGSGPAFFAYMLNAMVEAGVTQGLSRENALLLCEQTMLGTSRLLVETQPDPLRLIRAVASAKGTTAAGLAQLEASEIKEIIARAVQAAAQRSRELSVV
jgi:pyrroline-5-carboxylate reductase